MPEEDQKYDFPLIPVLLLVGIFILGALMEAFNWSPFW